MIIDSNTHITSDGKWFESSLDSSVSALLSQMNQSGVDRSIVVPLPGIISNEDLIKTCSAHPKRLKPAYTFDPSAYSSPSESAQKFQAEILSLPFSLVKFHNRFAKYQPEDERFISVLQANNEATTPHVVMICGYLNDKSSTAFTDPVAYFFNLLIRFSKTIFIVGHSAGPFVMQLAESCKSLPNFYMDLSYAISRYRNCSLEQDMRWLCHNLDRKITWGSDFPEVNQERALEDLRQVISGISEEKFANITGANISKLLHL